MRGANSNLVQGGPGQKKIVVISKYVRSNDVIGDYDRTKLQIASTREVIQNSR